MSSPRLRTQFERLFEHFQGEDCDIQIEELMDVLCCTRRNTRIVLNKLAEEGWIEWIPAAGRGKLSQLLFKRSKTDVSEGLAKRYLEDGKIEHALSVLDNDPARLTQLFQSYLGFSQLDEGQQVIRLPYYRQLATLNPLKPTRRSEQHIIRQIFNGLTRLDENENLQADLAHHWEMLTPQHWRFYLRSGVRFHNGDRLKVEDVIVSIEGLNQFPLFEHIESVTSPALNIIDINLNAADHFLPLLLTETPAKIQQAGFKNSDDYDIQPNGTGPYRVTRNDQERLILEASDYYFGFRPLIERVEVWVIDEVHSAMVYPGLSIPNEESSEPASDVALDPGCTYLLLNRHQGLAKCDGWADYLAYKLNPFNLMKEMPDNKIIELGLLHAHGLKPGWRHSVRWDSEPNLPFEDGDKPHITIAYHAKHPIFSLVFTAIKALLQQDGIKVSAIKYDVTLDNPEEVDIWLKPMGIATHRPDALLGWLLGYSDINIMSKPECFSEWKAMISQWRESGEGVFPAQHLAKQLVQHKQVLPMFHCWLGVNQDQCGTLQNATCNALGWFDFSQVWLKPE